MKKINIAGLLFFLMLFASQSYACTTFLISGKYTADGKSILFKNRDTEQMQNSLYFFNDGKFKYIALVDGDKKWNKSVWGGYNETGFAIINSAAYNNNVGDTTTFKGQDGVLMKLALQNCKTLADFEHLLDSLPKPLGVNSNYGVIDAFGGAAFYETGNSKYIKVDANDAQNAPNGILVRTNHSLSADLTKGFGFCRYNTACSVLDKAAEKKELSSQFLFNNISRNLYHSLTKTDLTMDMPERRDVPEFKFFIDYIPRILTSSAIMIVGAKDQKHVKDAMMWTILGFPLTSVAIPTWVSAGDKLPKVVSMDTSFRAPICVAALKLKDDCFPLKYDHGNNYINLSAVINKQNNGYMQLLRPIENEIFDKANLLMAGLEKGKKTEKDIQSFYTWIDSFLSTKYKEQFNINLMNNMN